MLTAMVVSSGEMGYRRVSVQDVIDAYGGNRVQFYRHFSSKADCYEAAYELEIERLAGRVLEAAGAEPEWRRGVRAGARGARRLCRRGPGAGPRAADRGPRRRRAVDGAACGGGKRLAAKIDAGRGIGGKRPPPPITGQFMVGAIESSLTAALAAGEPGAFGAAVPALTHMVVSAYLGEEEAGKALAAASAA